MKRALAILLILACLLGAGCAAKTTYKAGQAANEIVTYDPLDPDKTTITISRTGNIYIDSLVEAFEAANPDIQAIVIDITGGNDQYKPLSEWLENGAAPDVLITQDNSFTDEQCVRYFENLSNKPYTALYSSEALTRASVNANVYFLPGPSQVDCMMYNKTLFEQYGWAVPKTFDEFVALCKQITEDTDGQVQPWNPNAKYDGELMTVLEGFSYGELFAGVDNYAWYRDFLAGNASFLAHMAPFYAVIQTLIDEGLLVEEHFTYSATARGEEFAAGKLAMFNASARPIPDAEYAFDFMPFPSTDGKDGYICDRFYSIIGVPVKTRTEKQTEAVERFMTFLSSDAGQRAFIGEGMMISNVQDVSLGESDPLASLRETIRMGHVFELISFRSESAYANFNFQKDALAMVRGEKTAEMCLAETDADPFRVGQADADNPPEKLAEASEDFTILETSFLLADLYREKTGANVALIANNLAYRGNLMRIFKGDLTTANAVVLKPRSFANGSALVKVNMTGRQLLDALDDPLGNVQIPNCTYAYSGLICEIAPWNPLGEKMLSVKLADGSEIDPSKTYTVACWEGTVQDMYLGETVERYDAPFEELLAEYLRKAGTIAPAKDGRVKLVWN